MHTTLIDAATLAGHLTDPDWIVIDCRHDLMDLEAGRAAYAAGHIQNAQFADMEHDLAGPKVGPDGKFHGRHPLPDRAALIEKLRQWGVNDQSQVVAYDAHGGMYAARLWWLLRWIGHPAVAVLDGGLAAWHEQGLPLVTPVATRPRGHIMEKPTLTKTVTAAELVGNLAGGMLKVIDARAPDRFRGENEVMDPVGGHIPGAKNRFFKDNLLSNGRFKNATQLTREFGPLFDTVSDVVMQCGSGVTACHNLLALEVAGLSGAALYPGSWSEWCADPARPVAKGEA
ncbi:sulfurtransferase [Rugamonas apoptosis]|uniref:Sulfurtransferase n=1 Tax=Rugamonas apoptosis TaxID=2758570 RepID=A0A7W2FBC6_9BURK|nr:sulfurtransferase [Rugamonas apoptosis]MBA5688497.1 sulfurtransferase [Rugamonas apoptosis]